MSVEENQPGWGTKSTLFKAQLAMQEMFMGAVAGGEAPFNKFFEKEYSECTEEEVKEAMKQHDLHTTASMAALQFPQHPGVTSISIEAGSHDGLTCDISVHYPNGHLESGTFIPGIVHLHGGGFYLMSGKEDLFRYAVQDQANAGCVVMSVHYRQAYEVDFQTQVDDCLNAIKWFATKRCEYCMVPEAGFMVMGESAGGCLTILSALHLKGTGLISCINPQCPCYFPWAADPDQIEGGIPKVIADSAVKFANLDVKGAYPMHKHNLTVYPVLHRSNGTKDLTNPLCWPWYCSDEQITGFPPIFCEYDEGDFLSAEARAMLTRFDNCGNTVRAIMHAGTMHGGEGMDFETFFWLPAMRLAWAKKFCVKPEAAVEEEKGEN